MASVPVTPVHPCHVSGDTDFAGTDALGGQRGRARLPGGFASCQAAQLCPTELKHQEHLLTRVPGVCICICSGIPTDMIPTGGEGAWEEKHPTNKPPSNSVGFLQAPTCQAGLLWSCSLSKHLHLFHTFNPSLSAIRRKRRSFSD